MVSSKDQGIRHPVLHPFLISVYPVIALLAHNIEEVQLKVVWRPLIISILISLGMFALFNVIFHEKHKAGIVTTIFLLLLFSYGHIYEFFEGSEYFGDILGRHRYLAVIYLIIMALSIFWIMTQAAKLPRMTYLLNVCTIVLLLIPIMQLGLFQIRLFQSYAESQGKPIQPANLNLHSQDGLRDVYYLILDGYARDDVLQKYYQYDNQLFLDYLSEKGFYIPECSLSNYAQTQLSLASSLNLSYLESLGGHYIAGNTSRIGLSDLIQHSETRRLFEQLGYQVIAFDTGYESTRWKDADLYLTPRVVADIDGFEEMFIRTTAARLITEGVVFLDIPPDWEKRDQLHRERILFSLKNLSKVPDISGPKFVFAHLITPHWPHVFGPNGEAVHEHNDSVSGYRNQVVFINRQIEPILNTIITRSAIPPIIILQGDHGSVIESPQQRMSILNAYYLPDRSTQDLYSSISPVNTFRLIFNLYFNADLPLLEDTSYYSQYESPYEFQQYNDNRPGCPSKASS